MSDPFDSAGTDKRLINQYAASPSVIAMIKALVDEGRSSIRATLSDLRLRLSIADMEGVNLDRIGAIVGQSRPFDNPDESQLFAFDGGTGQGFSGIDRDDVGGLFTGLDPLAGARVVDARYRRIIRARILINNGGATISEMLFFVAFAFDTWATVSSHIGSVGLTVGRRLGQQDIALLLDLFPIAAGVRLDYIASPLPGSDVFSFAGGNGSGFAGLAPETLETAGAFVGVQEII